MDLFFFNFRNELGVRVCTMNKFITSRTRFISGKSFDTKHFASQQAIELLIQPKWNWLLHVLNGKNN